jgi:hypothetical protein
MYCSSCGVAVTQGLSYCNYCGAKVSGATPDSLTKSSEAKPEALIAGMVMVFVFGLAAITLLMGMMKSVLNLGPGPVLAFTMLSFIIMLLLESVFIFLLVRRRRGTVETSDAIAPRQQATNELDAAQMRRLPEPVPSVTEHTTRTFDPIYTERTSR